MLNINWKYKIDISEYWNESSESNEINDDSKLMLKDLTFQLKKIYNIEQRKHPDEDTMFELEELIEHFEFLLVDIKNFKSKEDFNTEFNYIFEDLYNWADYNKTCWIKTQ